jgi:hypothetical protein
MPGAFLIGNRIPIAFDHDERRGESRQTTRVQWPAEPAKSGADSRTPVQGSQNLQTNSDPAA